MGSGAFRSMPGRCRAHDCMTCRAHLEVDLVAQKSLAHLNRQLDLYLFEEAGLTGLTPRLRAVLSENRRRDPAMVPARWTPGSAAAGGGG